MEGKKFDWFSFTTTDLVIIAIIAAVFGVIGVYNQLITNLLIIPFGFYGGMIVGGLFQTPGIMAYAIMKKKGASFVTQNLFGIAQLLFGNPFGFLLLLFTFSQSLGQELTFFCSKYKRAGDWKMWALAGAVSWIFAQVPNYALYGFGDMAWWSWLIPLIVVGIPSSILFPTLLTKAVLKIVPARFISK